MGWRFLTLCQPASPQPPDKSGGFNSGFAFRRQHPIEFYIADFYCHNLRLVIEVDNDLPPLTSGESLSRFGGRELGGEAGISNYTKSLG